jgi:hypothetical protein
MSAQDQRPLFYEGQYLAADDVSAIVEYGHVQSARHELGAHTWGTLIGLTLVERDTPGSPKQKLVYLTPGVADDGFGRKLSALSYTRLSESLFSNIPYDGTVDDPAQNNGVPPGRFVKVWIAYDEKAGQAAQPGFVACDAGGTSSRVQETYRFVIGDPLTSADRRSPVSVGGQTLDAAQAVKYFDPSAPVLTDASIPQQQFPETTQGVKWLVPVGVVRWVVGAGGGGYFVDRDINQNDKGTERIRRQMRAYSGVIGETVSASDGALVLRDRGADPTKPGRFQERLQSAEPLSNIRNDLVWVEGNLRIVGDERLAGGALRFVDVSGHDGGTPMSVERLGDQNANPGQRSLDAIIGPDAQADNRFAVSTVVTDDPNPVKRVLGEKLTVLSGGNVGIGKPAPQYRLHVAGDRIRLESGDGAKAVDLRTDDTDVTLESTTNNLYVRATGGVPVHNLLLNAADADGNVGVGTSSPGYKLDVKSKNGIKLGLEGNGGGQLVLANNPGDNMIYLEGFDQAGTGTAAEMILSGRWGANLPRLAVNANVTYVSNQLGVGTNAPGATAHVIGESVLLENAARNKRILLFNSGSEVDLYTDTNSLSLRSNNHHCLINWLAGDGYVGVGTGTPQQKLHVGGPFLLIDGAGNEQVYIGGDGVASDAQIGSMNASIRQVTCWNTATNTGMDIAAVNFVPLSDADLKEDVRPLTGALEALRRIRGVRFKWRNNGEKAKRDEIGVIAQEVGEVLPDAVRRVRGHAGVSLNALVSVLIEAVKEVSGAHDALQKKHAELERKVAALIAEPAPPESGSRHDTTEGAS